MKPTDFKHANLTLNKPKDLTDDQCQPLRVCQRTNSFGGNEFISKWELDEEELSFLLKHKALYISVWGDGHPPILPMAFNPFEKEEYQTITVDEKEAFEKVYEMLELVKEKGWIYNKQLEYDPISEQFILWGNIYKPDVKGSEIMYKSKYFGMDELTPNCLSQVLVQKEFEILAYMVLDEKFEKYSSDVNPTVQLIEALKKDPELFNGWQANIAMAFVDAVAQNPEKEVREVANIAAFNFLSLLTK